MRFFTHRHKIFRAIGYHFALTAVLWFVCTTAIASQGTSVIANAGITPATAAASANQDINAYAETIPAASADSAKVTFHFVVNRTDITLDVPHSSLPSNKEAMALLRTYMESFRNQGMLQLRQICIQGVSSPDGLRVRNQVLAQGRHDSMLAFLRSEFPEIPASLYQEEVIAEDWDGTARMLEQADIPGKEEALTIIRNTPLHIYNNGKLIDSRKRQLMRLNAGETWRQMQSRIFPKLRKADIWFYFEPATRNSGNGNGNINSGNSNCNGNINSSNSNSNISSGTGTGYGIGNDSNNATGNNATGNLGATLAAAGLVSSLVVVPESLRPHLVGIPALEASARDIRRPLFAVGTNLLYDALITPNISVEVPLGHNWSIQAAYTFPWWVNRANDMAWQILKWDLGARWWFSPKNRFNPMDVLRGHFLGLELSAGYYDIEPKHSGWQGEAVVATLEYGYSWRLGKNWRLSACIGAGWLYSPQYRAYQGTQDDKHLIYQHNGNLNWFGPTKASVGIQYLFHYTKKYRQK